LNFLVKFRKSAGKPTILISDIPFSEIPASEFKNTVSDFKQIHVDPLDNAGVLTYVDVLEKAERKNDDAPTLAPDAKALLANEFVQDLSTLAHTIKFFINNADIEDGHEITADEVDATIHK
jgi:hypothetical protein